MEHFITPFRHHSKNTLNEFNISYFKNRKNHIILILIWIKIDISKISTVRASHRLRLDKIETDLRNRISGYYRKEDTYRRLRHLLTDGSWLSYK